MGEFVASARGEGEIARIPQELELLADFVVDVCAFSTLYHIKHLSSCKTYQGRTEQLFAPGSMIIIYYLFKKSLNICSAVLYARRDLPTLLGS